MSPQHGFDGRPGRSARLVLSDRHHPGIRPPYGGSSLGDPARLRVLRFLQGACGGLRTTDLPVGLVEDAPSGGVLRRDPHPRSGDVSQAAATRRRPHPRHRRTRRGRERLRRCLPGGKVTWIRAVRCMCDPDPTHRGRGYHRGGGAGVDTSSSVLVFGGCVSAGTPIATHGGEPDRGRCIRFPAPCTHHQTRPAVAGSRCRSTHRARGRAVVLGPTRGAGGAGTGHWFARHERGRASTG